jgi:hypothetical protein
MGGKMIFITDGLTADVTLARDANGRLFNPSCVNQKPLYGANLDTLWKDFGLKSIKPKKNRNRKRIGGEDGSRG